MKNNKYSLYTALVITIILAVIIIMSSHSAYNYISTKNKIIEEMKHSSKLTGMSLQKNITNLIASYSLNEYDKLIFNEMGARDNFAIVVEDYKMGEILGTKAYISGKIRDASWNIVNYDQNNAQQNEKLHNSYYSDKYDITTPSGNKLGTITIYSSNSFMNTELNKIIVSTVINSIAISVLLILAFFILIHFFVLKPLSEIMKILSNSDDDGIPIRLIQNDDYSSAEISALSSTMNNMISSIKSSRISLREQHNELLEQKDILHHQAHHDYLTGLPNRILFNDRLEHAIKKATLNGRKIALFFIDLDHFKEINDSLGHEFGDELLKEVTKYLKEIARKGDTLARLGGDEFTVIIEDLKQAQDASIFAQKMIEALSKPITIDNKQIYISSSIGISIYPDDGTTAQNLFEYADAAMYKAKDEGRNNFQYYSAEMTELAHERVIMETKLREALKNEEFVVYYQPQINGKTDELVGMEALVRWKSPSMGLISPFRFIPIAVSTGLIIELDRFVMRSAMTQIASWYKEGLNPGVIAMNMSVKQLQQKDFITHLENLIKESGCKAEWIELEITEGQIMTNPEEAIKILTKISTLGIQLAVDDFGTGYSSLSYLKKLPINKLKIDKSFIDNLPYDEEDIAITRAVIALANSLNLKIIAEGVENAEQKEFLIQNGCEKIQGYFYAKPMPADEMKEFILKLKESK